jgi:hypothetical protein
LQTGFLPSVIIVEHRSRKKEAALKDGASQLCLSAAVLMQFS